MLSAALFEGRIMSRWRWSHVVPPAGLALAAAAVLIAPLFLPAVAEAAAWSVVVSPSPGALGNELNAVASVSANDVWAVGEFTNAFPGRTLTLHWNGTSCLGSADNWVFSETPG